MYRNVSPNLGVSFDIGKNNCLLNHPKMSLYVVVVEELETKAGDN